ISRNKVICYVALFPPMRGLQLFANRECERVNAACVGSARKNEVNGPDRICGLRLGAYDLAGAAGFDGFGGASGSGTSPFFAGQSLNQASRSPLMRTAPGRCQG